MHKHHKKLSSLLKCKCSLRERKYAKTKKVILDAFIEKLKTQHLEDISVKELCDDIQISEGTFYNYFPKKTDVLVYLIAVWSIEVKWLAREKEKEGSSIKAIEEIFYFTADEMFSKGPVMFEVIAYLAKLRDVLEVEDISTAEKLFTIPDKNKIEEIKASNIFGMTKPLLEKAIEKGELPKETNIESVQLSLRSIFFGAPMAVSQAHVDKIKMIYQKQLKMLWGLLGNNNK